jgi:hypothetical protein
MEDRTKEERGQAPRREEVKQKSTDISSEIEEEKK